MLEAEQQFRKIIGFNDLAKLAIAVEQDVAAKRAAAFTRQPLNAHRPRRRRSPLPPSEIIHSRTAVTKVPRRAGHPQCSRATSSS
jgi:hypothetical protein